MSDSDTETEETYDSKTQFMDAVKEEGAVLGGVEYFRGGSGSGATYHARGDDGEVEQVTKAEIESLWEEMHGNGADDAEDADEDEPEEVHLGTYYWASAWTDEDREAFEEAIADLDWYVSGEVSSGGLRVSTER